MGAATGPPGVKRGPGEGLVQMYRRDVWDSQPVRIEVWLEKDALSGIFEETLDGYGVTLNVGRDFDGWDSIHNAARRLGDEDVVLYFGDFDPSGEDMVRSLRERLADQGARPEIVKCALTSRDIEAYELPADLTKASDSRSPAFVAKWGDISVELDALPIEVLRERIVGEVEQRMDLTGSKRFARPRIKSAGVSFRHSGQQSGLPARPAVIALARTARTNSMRWFPTRSRPRHDEPPRNGAARGCPPIGHAKPRSSSRAISQRPNGRTRIPGRQRRRGARQLHRCSFDRA